MDYTEALKRLANHANMPIDETVPAEQGLLFALWQATRMAELCEIEDRVADVISCFEAVNAHLNTETPDGSARTPEGIPRDLALVVGVLIAGCQEYALLREAGPLFSREECRELNRAVWTIAQSWCAVLHGDIDSIYEDLENQAVTKGI